MPSIGRPRPRLATALPPANADAVQGSLLLIVDDVPANLVVLGDLLHEANDRVRAANSGASALRYAAQAPHPSLILLDVMMPARSA